MTPVPRSPIHRPIDDDDPPPVPPAHSRITRLASLDSRILSGTARSLGPGGSSAAFANAVNKALVDEMADQLRGVSGNYSEISDWAAEIIAAFRDD